MHGKYNYGSSWNATKSAILRLFSVADKNIPVCVRSCRQQLHARFMQNGHLADRRQIDVLIFNSQLELKDIQNMRRDDVMAKYLPHYCKQTPKASDSADSIMKV